MAQKTAGAPDQGEREPRPGDCIGEEEGVEGIGRAKERWEMETPQVN